MRAFSIKTTIILATTIVLGIVFAGFSLVVYQRAEIAYVGRLDAKLQGYAETLREEVEEQKSENRFPSGADFKELELESMAGASVRLSDYGGKAVFTDSLLIGPASRPRFDVKPGEFMFEDFTINGVRYRSLRTRIEAEDRDRYAMEIVFPLSEVEASLKLLQILFLVGVPVALAISAIAVYTIVVISFAPLSAMVRTTETISASNLSERIPVPQNQNEVHDLALTLNTMMERIERAFKSQKQFIADASHEIRTPLAIIRSELEYVQNHATGLSDETSLHTAMEEVDRLKKLSDELLLLARLDAAAVTPRTEVVRLDELLADCVKKIQPLADSKRISLFLTVHSATEIKGDEERLRSAIINLLDNAIKYSYDGGNVEITTRSAGGSVEVSVRDHGEGIPGDEIEYIFDRFHRVASSRAHFDGSGLGLAIVRKILELHKGTVSVQSKEGEGTTFTIALPHSSS